MEEAEYVYDQLSALSPIFLAMSASSPIWRGYLANVDTRMPSMQQTNDDRIKEERLNKSVTKSRFDVTECYLSKEAEKFNDKAMPRNEDVFKRLVEAVIYFYIRLKILTLS